MPSTSRMAPSTTMPPSFLAAAVWHISSPNTRRRVAAAGADDDDVARLGDLQRLVHHEVVAGPADDRHGQPAAAEAGSRADAGSMKLKRPMASARFDDASAAESARRGLPARRGGDGRMRKPSLPRGAGMGANRGTVRMQAGNRMYDAIRAGRYLHDQLPIGDHDDPAAACSCKTLRRHRQWR